VQSERRPFQFSLRTLFICTALVGPSLLAIKDSGEWIISVAIAIIVFGIGLAVTCALANANIRRLSWAALAAVMCVSLPDTLMLAPRAVPIWLWGVMHLDRNSEGRLIALPPPQFDVILYVIAMITITTIVAYIIPWLSKRRHEHSRESTDGMPDQR